MLFRAEEDGNSDHDDSSPGPEPEDLSARADNRPFGKDKEKHNIEKRKNKHAYAQNSLFNIWISFDMYTFRPMEMSSKRPVPRKKVEIEDKQPVSPIRIESQKASLTPAL